MKSRVKTLTAAIGLVLAGGLVAAAVIGPATAAGENPKAWGAGTAEVIDNYTSQQYQSILEKTISAPGDGALTITAAVGIEDDCSIDGLGRIIVRLRVDNKPVWKVPDSFEIVPNTACAGPERQVRRGLLGGPSIAGEGSLTATIPITSGSHSVQFQAAEVGSGTYIQGRGLSIVFLPSGTGPYPWPGDQLKP